MANTAVVWRTFTRIGRVNVDVLRLAQIPAELEKELAAICTRFANPTPRMFPVVMTFLMPEKLA